MNYSNISEIDELFGDFGLKEVTIEDKVIALIPDAVFVNGKNKSERIPKNCKIGEWHKLIFYKGSTVLVFWTQNQKAYKMRRLKSLMKSVGCDTSFCYPYENGEWG